LGPCRLCLLKRDIGNGQCCNMSPAKQETWSKSCETFHPNSLGVSEYLKLNNSVFTCHTFTHEHFQVRLYFVSNESELAPNRQRLQTAKADPVDAQRATVPGALASDTSKSPLAAPHITP